MAVADNGYLPLAAWNNFYFAASAAAATRAALMPSWQRFAGTALGAAAGALAATYFGASTVVFTISIFVLGLLCALLRLDRTAYRFAGTTLAIVVLASHEKAGWVSALHRFVEVSIGIAVGLAIIAVWPEREGTAIATPRREGRL